MADRPYPEALRWTSLTNQYLCVDLETTSLEPEGEGILELYWKLMKDGQKVDEGHQVFWHHKFFQTRKIHQIPFTEMAFKKSFKNQLRKDLKKGHGPLLKFKELLLKCVDPDEDIAMMAHYAPFEVKWLQHHMGVDLEKDSLKLFDTRAVERYLHPEVDSVSLIPTCKRRGIEPPNGIDFHRAKWDVDAMYQVAEQQFEELLKKGKKVGDRWRTVG